MHFKLHTLILLATPLLFGHFSTVVFAQEAAVTRSVLRAAVRHKYFPKQSMIFGNLHYAPPVGVAALDVKTLSYCPPASVATTAATAADKTGVSLADAKGKVTGKHSIVPSAMTILGSDAFRTKQQEQLGALRRADNEKQTKEYLTPKERSYWAEEREKLIRIWNLADPTPTQQLYEY